ncbi:MAG TPA: Mpo1-like protein [Limnobacter sp.]|uniref:Mpo1 family 2-hydroxy fatty acid dioxygenase n=1 Tax=Limnobacter sp. TaxID=2003368 RepID=UPI002E2FC479|nr:Mpo1-like protein [Limnobacter sp.]HEX5486444.1 Mpo1-like protein [Limnobacter sp.]
MKTLVDQLSQYAAYHRDSRNIATHFVGIPLIVLAVFVLLARPHFVLFGLSFTPALLVFIASSIFYFRLSLIYGLAMFAIHGVLLSLANHIAVQTFPVWLSVGVGVFVLGWVIQFVGHYFEGRKPAFVDDLIGLAVGPLFVVAELGFIVGLGKQIERDIETRSGPVRRQS